MTADALVIQGASAAMALNIQEKQVHVLVLWNDRNLKYIHTFHKVN